MKAKKRILSFILAVTVAAAAFPIAAYAEPGANGEAQNRAVERHIGNDAEMRERYMAEQKVRERETFEDAQAAGAENGAEAEAAAYDDPAVITVSSGSYAAEQGGILEITNDKLSVEGEYFSLRDDVYGTVTFTGAETYKVNYFRINVFEDKYENDNYVYYMNLYLPREIKPGTYTVSIDLKSLRDYDNYIVKGGFELTISGSTAAAPVIGALGENGEPIDSVSVNYDENFNIYSDFGNINNIYAISSEVGNTIYLYSNKWVEYASGVLPGEFKLSALIDNFNDGSYSFSNSVGLKLNQPENVGVDQTSAAELSFNTATAYNNEIYFKKPITNITERFNIKFINKQTGETVMCDWGSYPINCELITENEYYDPESYEMHYDCLGVNLYGYQFPYYLPEGEYELYLYTDSIEVGPIDVKCYAYNLGLYSLGLNYSKLSKKTKLYYYFVSDDPIAEMRVLYADITISDENGKVLTSRKVKPTKNYYMSSLDMDFVIDTPDIPTDGAYVISTELKFDDGTSRRLMSRHICFGEFYTAFIEDVDHDCITPETKSIGVTMDFDCMIPDFNDIYLTLIDKNGEEIGRSSRFYNVPAETVSAIYVIDITGDLSDAESDSQYYTIKANSKKNVELMGITKIAIQSRDVPLVVSSKRTGQNTYDFITENIEPGTYNTYDYHSSQINGTLNVESNGAAVWTMTDPDPDRYYSSFYLQTGTDYNGDPILSHVSYVYSNYIALPSVGDSYYRSGGTNAAQHSYISAGTLSAKNKRLTLYTETIPKREDIISVKLLSDGNVIAEGENIRLDNFNTYYNQYYNQSCWITALIVDFPSIDMSKVVDGSAVLQVMTTFGELTLDFRVAADNEYLPTTYSYIYPDTVNGYISNNLTFGIDDTNFTEGEIRLYEVEDGTETNLIDSKQLSELKRTDGFLYSYTGSFNEVLEPGKEYTLKYYNKSVEDSGVDPENVISGLNNFTTTDKPMFELYSDASVSADMQDIYLLTANINYDSDRITAYYEEGGKQIDIPVTAERVEIGDVYYYYANEMRFTFDFSKVPYFQEMDIHLLVNGEEAGILDLYDYRDKFAIQSGGLILDQDRECVCIDGFNIYNENITLKIYNIEEYNYKTTIGDKVRETAVDPDMGVYYNDYYKIYIFPLDSLYLPEGKYYYELCLDGEPILSDEYGYYINGIFTIGAAEIDPDIPAAVTGRVLEGSEMKVDLLNMSGGEIKANVIVGAYDENGALIDLSGEVPVTLAPNGELKGVSVPTAADAARYKVFVWDSLKDMRPYSKAN